jgi:hypothetical protein
MAAQPVVPSRPSTRRALAPLYFRGRPASSWQDALARRGRRA